MWSISETASFICRSDSWTKRHLAIQTFERRLPNAAFADDQGYSGHGIVWEEQNSDGLRPLHQSLHQKTIRPNAHPSLIRPTLTGMHTEKGKQHEAAQWQLPKKTWKPYIKFNNHTNFSQVDKGNIDQLMLFYYFFLLHVSQEQQTVSVRVQSPLSHIIEAWPSWTSHTGFQ